MQCVRFSTVNVHKEDTYVPTIVPSKLHDLPSLTDSHILDCRGHQAASKGALAREMDWRVILYVAHNALCGRFTVPKREGTLKGLAANGNIGDVAVGIDARRQE